MKDGEASMKTTCKNGVETSTVWVEVVFCSRKEMKCISLPDFKNCTLVQASNLRDLVISCHFFISCIFLLALCYALCSI